MRASLVLLLCILLLNSAQINCTRDVTSSVDFTDFTRFLNNVKSDTPAEEQRDAALEVISRLIPERAHEFAVEINVSLPLNTFKVFFKYAIYLSF